MGSFTHWGFYPWYWASAWSILLWLILAPIIIMATHTVASFIRRQNERSKRV